MFEILKAMIKEEWRIHSSMFGSLMFALFPAMLALFSFAFSVMLPFLQTVFPANQISFFVFGLFLILGISVGGFGLHGREMMNRRFGHASLLAYSSRTLPLSERKIFLNFFIKDVIYYLVLWIFPFSAGLILASPFITIDFVHSLAISMNLTLLFLLGLSLSFFLSTIYAHFGKIFLGIIVFFSVVLSFSNFMTLFSFFTTPSFSQFIFSLAIVFMLSSVSLVFLRIDYPEKKRMFKNSLDSLSEKISFIKYPHFVSKDFLDLHRSEGGFGKIIFSFLLPLVIIYILLHIFIKFVQISDFLLVFSIFLGVVSSSIYNWLTEFDLFTSYSFLPVKVSDIIKSKISSYVIINSISLIILIAAAFITGFSGFVLALFSFISVSAFAMSTTIYFTGLYPNILLYNAKILLKYIFSNCPVLVILLFSAVVNPFYLIFSPVLVPVSFYIIMKSFKKWDNWEHPNF